MKILNNFWLFAIMPTSCERYYYFIISFSLENHIFAGLILCELKIACNGRKTDPANA